MSHKDDNPQKDLILSLSAATSKALVDGLSEKFDGSMTQVVKELHEMKVALLGSELDKSAGVIPILKARMKRVESTVIVLALAVIGLLLGSPKDLIAVVAKIIK